MIRSSSTGVALQTAGTLAALIFLVSSVFEVLVINNLYQAQHQLIGLLLCSLAAWAWLELALIERQPGSPSLRSLRWLMTVQLALVVTRHASLAVLNHPPLPPLDSFGITPSLEKLILFLAIDFVLFLWICHAIISAFSSAEALRSMQLMEQIQILHRTQVALEQSETRYRTFFDLPLVGNAILAGGRGWIAFNNEMCQIFGYSREQLLATPWQELVHPDNQQHDAGLLRRALHGEISRFRLETRFLRRDGSVGHALVAGGRAPVASEPDHPLVYLNLIDISDRKRAEADLAATREREQAAALLRRQELEQKLKTSLTASAVAHEIQQPLSTILLNSRLANEIVGTLVAGALPEKLRDKLQAIAVDGERVAATMERMRMLLRNVETAHSSVDLAANLHSALVFLRGSIEAHGVMVCQDGLDQPCHLQGDGAQLQMAVVNLIRNALQAMEGQPPASRRLLVQLERRRQQLRVVVADSGPGFPADHSNDISWELLKSTKATGMGLGLFLAQTAAANHQGSLRIGRSADLGGAEVVMELPLLIGESQPA